MLLILPYSKGSERLVDTGMQQHWIPGLVITDEFSPESIQKLKFSFHSDKISYSLKTTSNKYE
jgi:hypothetical protein